MDLPVEMRLGVLKFLSLWPGAVVRIVPFRQQDRYYGPQMEFVYLGRVQGRDTFLPRLALLGQGIKYRLWPGTYKCNFRNIGS